MKKGLLLLSTTALLLTACMNKQQGTIDNDLVASNEDVDFAPKSFLMTEDKLPEKIDYDMDISDMTLMELRLLKNYPYALHGLWFTEADLNGFFSSKSEWYFDKCYKYSEAHGYNPLLKYSAVKLSAKEKEFVDRVDERIKELQKNNFVEVDDLKLSNVVNTINMFQLEEYDQDFLKQLAHHNFSIMPSNNEQLFNVYEENEYNQMPNFITTDLYLQAFHMYFSYVLKSLEKHTFVDYLDEFYVSMNERAMIIAEQESTDAETRDLAEYIAAFYAIAEKLLNDKDLEVPESYKSIVESELNNIMACRDTNSPMQTSNGKVTDFAYSLFKPRGHYTRSEEQKRYFRSMMWLQTATFCRETKLSLKRVAMMAYVFNTSRHNAQMKIYNMSHLLDFLMGTPDNVSIMEIADVLSQGRDMTLDDVTDMGFLQSLNNNLIKKFKAYNRIKSKKSDGGCDDKINFMPQRYTPDAEVLSNMYDQTPNSERAFPKGLDVFSAFGCKHADEILDTYYDEHKQWGDYKKYSDKMKNLFSNYTDEQFGASMYTKWFECLVKLQKTHKDYPGFMKTYNWQSKNLNSALASWAELKHDAILYAEQPMGAECGGGSDFPDPISKGYIEPNMLFWKTMRKAVLQTRKLLEDNALMTYDLDGVTTQMTDYMDFCIKVSAKELRGEVLTEEEYSEIEHLGSSLEWFTLSVIDPDANLGSWGLVQGADRSIAVVADVFTRDILGCDKCGILYEAVGNADYIYVIVNIGDDIVLTRGAVFSYYEFINELGDRLTDEQWQEKLEKKAPARPKWMQHLIHSTKNAPIVNEEIFYSTGC